MTGNKYLTIDYYKSSSAQDALVKGGKRFGQIISALLALGVLVGLCAATGTLSVVIGGSILQSAGWLGVMSVTQMATIGAIGGAIFAPLTMLVTGTSTASGVRALAIMQGTEPGFVERASVLSTNVLVYGSVFSFFGALVGAKIMGMNGVAIGFSAAAGAIGAFLSPIVSVLGMLLAVTILIMACAMLASCCSRNSKANTDLPLKTVDSTIKPVFTHKGDPCATLSTTKDILVSPLVRFSQERSKTVGKGVVGELDIQPMHDSISKNQPTFA